MANLARMLAAAAWLVSPPLGKALRAEVPLRVRQWGRRRWAPKTRTQVIKDRRDDKRHPEVVTLYKSFKAGDAMASLRVYNAMKKPNRLPTSCYDGLLVGLARIGEARACRAILRDMAAAGVARSEASYSALIQALVNEGDLDAAARALEDATDAKNTVEPRLRTFAPLIKGLCERGRPLEARALWRKMLLEHCIEPTGEQFADAVVALVRAVYADTESSPPLQSYYVDELRAVLREMEIYLLEGLAGDLLEAVKRAIDETADFFHVRADWVATLENATKCPVTGIERLASPGLDVAERRRFRDRLLDVAAASTRKRDARESLETFGRWLDQSPYTAVVDGPNVAYFKQNFPGGGFSVAQVALVVSELQALGHVPLVVMPAKYCEDGVVPNHSKSRFTLPPSIAKFHNRNASSSLKEEATLPATTTSSPSSSEDAAAAAAAAGQDEDDDDEDDDEDDDASSSSENALASQIRSGGAKGADSAEDKQQSRTRRPQQHQQQRRYDPKKHGERTQTLSEKDVATLKGWAERGSLYAVPRGCHDDTYWMLATVTGKAPLVVTNDKIRDHWHKLVGARAYRRWVSASVATFDILGRTDSDEIEAKIVFPSPVVRMVHRTSLPHHDERSSTTAWHVPDTTPGSTRWLCLRVTTAAAQDNWKVSYHDPDAVRALTANWADRFSLVKQLGVGRLNNDHNSSSTAASSSEGGDSSASGSLLSAATSSPPSSSSSAAG